MPSPLPSNTETLLESELAVAKSGRPSPLKSLAAIQCGWVPTLKSPRAMNETVWVRARSGMADKNKKIAATRNNPIDVLVMLKPWRKMARDGDLAAGFSYLIRSARIIRL